MYNLNLRKNVKVINKPIRYVMIYLIFTQMTYLIMYYGKYSNMVITILYTTASYISLYMGFFPNWKIKIKFSKYDYDKSIENFIIFCAIVTSIISIYNVISFYSDLPIVKLFISNPGKAYEYVKFIKRNVNVQSTSILKSIIGIILNIFTFTKYFLGGFSILYWKYLDKRYKLLVIISIVIYGIHSFLMGAMVNIGSFFLSIFPFLLFQIEYKNRRTTWRAKLLLMVITITVFFLILYFLGTRGVFKLYDDTGVIMSGFLGLLFYVSHGYVGLSYSLNLPFRFTWGHTIFRGISTTILPYIGVNNLFYNSYLVRNQIQNDWSALQVWSTVFPWLASDITFWLIPVVMFMVGYFMKKAWKEAALFENPYALALLGQLFIFCFMIPANNQLFHTFGNSMGTLFIFMFYVKSLNKKSPIKKRRKEYV